VFAPRWLAGDRFFSDQAYRIANRVCSHRSDAMRRFCYLVGAAKPNDVYGRE
jgi:hypothetical protein